MVSGDVGEGVSRKGRGGDGITGTRGRESERTSAGDMVASRTGSCLIRSTELGRDFLMEVTFN